MIGKTQWRTRLWPRVPAAIADDLAILRLARLRALVPFLYATLIAVVSTSMLAASFEANFAIRFGIPLLIITAATLRLGWWLSHQSEALGADEARRQIRRTILISTSIAALCSLWAVVSWSLSEPGQRSYYPMFLAMGVLTTAFCLASVRCATIAILAMGNLPIIFALVIAGNRMDQIAASIVLLATIFLTRLILDQHRQQVEMLMLRRQLHDQAMTDPLTGLANRRALASAAVQVFADTETTPALILIDLDGFKPINDRHGHAAGDALLVEIARRLDHHSGLDAIVARLGGDEFAVLVTHDDAGGLRGRTSAMLAALAIPFVIDGQHITIGASAGLARAPADGRSLHELLGVADAALYAAKAARAPPAVASPAALIRMRRPSPAG